MNYWIFKVVEKSIYPDILGEQYAYDNTHSVRVAPDDEFLYLKKEKAVYALVGAGRVSTVVSRKPGRSERRSPKVDRMFA